MAAPAAAPAVEAAALALVLSLILTWVVLAGLKAGWQHSIGALLVKLAELTGHIWGVGDKLEDAILSVNHTVLNVLGRWLETNEKAIALWFHAHTWVIRQLADALSWFGTDVHTAIESLVTVTIPSTAGAIARPLREQLADAERALRVRVNDELRRFARGIDRLERDVTAEARARANGIDALAGTLTGRLGQLAGDLRGDIGALERHVRGALARRIGRLEQALAAGAIGAVALTVLTRAFPYWRCTNVRDMNRMVCRAPIGALDDLFGLSLLLVGGLSIEAFARDMQAIVGYSAEAVNGWVTED